MKNSRPDELNAHAEWVRGIVNRYAGPLTRYALLITGNMEQARDVVQDTFVRLCSDNAGSLNSHLAPWLFKVCRNRALDVRRKEGRMQSLKEVELNSQLSPEPSPAECAEQAEDASTVLQLLSKLPRNQQEVLRLKFQAGLRYQEISDLTGLTVTNVGFLIHTAIKTIREELQSKTRHS